MKISMKIILGFAVIILLIVILGINVVVNLDNYNEINKEQEARVEQILISKDILQLHTSITLVSMDSIIDKGNGKISSERIGSINSLFNEFHSVKDSFKKAADTPLEIEKAEAIVNAIEKLEPIIKKELKDLIENRGSDKEFEDMDDKIDNVAGDVEDNIKAVITSIDGEVKEADEKMHTISYDIKRNILMVVVVILLISVILAILLSSNISKRIKTLEDTARDLASGDGDLTKRLPVEGSDEIVSASREINKFIEKVQSTIANIKDSSNETASVANELSMTSMQIGRRVEDEAKIVSDTVKSGEEMKSLLENSITKSENTKKEILLANQNLEEARREILNVVSQISESSEVEVELAGKLNQLSSDAEAVKGVLTVIKDIADQTNLLALNAAIEAARAGENGRGFAVVADEVRQLAERTQKSLTEINATINVIVQSIIDASEQMNMNSKNINELSNISSEVEHKINDTSDIMRRTAHIAQESLDDTMKIVHNSQERIAKMEKINELSTSNARSVEEIATSSEHLHQMTENISKKLGEFRT